MIDVLKEMLGLVPIIVGGLSSGSFPAPAKGLTAWGWEHIWVVYSLFAMACFPIGIALTFGDRAIFRQLTLEPKLTLEVAVFGVLWGIGSLLFGVSLARLGMAISNAVVSGMVALLGSLGPLLIGSVRLSLTELTWVILGLSLLSLSLVVCLAASVLRDRCYSVPTQRVTRHSHMALAIVIVVMAGVMSALINVGFALGAPLARASITAGCTPALATVTVWIPILSGGLLFNIGYPVYLIWRNNSWNKFVNSNNVGMAWIRAVCMAVLWFGAFILYGIGSSKMGVEGTVYGWALFIAFSILTSNAWGAVTGEWKNSSFRAKGVMGVSVVLLISSLFVIAGHQPGH